MMPMFAETTNSDVITWGVILVLTTIAANIAVIIGTRQKQKREVSFEFEPASKVALDTLSTENTKVHEQIFAKIGGVERGAKSALETQVEIVRRDVIKCGNDISGLQASTELQNQSLARVESKLDRLIERK